MRWLFVGAGNMASSLIGGLLGSDVPAEHIVVMDPSVEACERVRQLYGVHSEATTDVGSAVSALFPEQQDQQRQLGLVIAVKPNIVQSVCEAFAQYQSHAANNDTPINAVIISVAAGVRESSMRAWLPAEAPLVRCMPNTPALLGLGATALFANAHCTEDDKQHAKTLLDAAGMTIWVNNEAELDAVTAVSGSGPAYFFYLIEHMTEAGVNLGLARDTAEKLAIQTAYGAASMARESEVGAARLRENVTSKGGTTAAALQVFNDRQTPAIINEALCASRDRAIQIGDDLT